MLSFIRIIMVIVSLHNNRTLTKTEVGARECGIAMMGLTILLVGRIWKTLD